MVLKKTSNNTTNEFQIQFNDNAGCSELNNLFLFQLQLKTLYDNDSSAEMFMFFQLAAFSQPESSPCRSNLSPGVY